MKATIKTYKRLFIMFFLFSMLLIGAVMNLEVQANNGGKMPVLSKYDFGTPMGDNHFSFQNKNDVERYYFADIIKFPDATWSIGDFILIISGVLMVLFGGDFIIEEVKELKEKN